MEKYLEHMKKNKKEDNTIIYAFCVILGGLMRIAYCWKYPVPVRDAFTYENIINEWITTGAIPENMSIPPLSMYLVKVSSELFGYPIIKTGVIVNVLLGQGIIIVLMRIAEIICPHQKMAVLFAGLFAATHYALIQFSGQLLRENSYLIFCCLSILCFLRYYRSRNAVAIVTCAVFVALSCLCRYEALEMLLLFSGAILLIRQIKITAKLKTLFLFLFSASLFFCLTVNLLGFSDTFFRNYYNRISKEKKKSDVYDSFQLNNIFLQQDDKRNQ